MQNFKALFRDYPGSRIAAFTAAQIAGISGRIHPGILAELRDPAASQFWTRKSPAHSFSSVRSTKLSCPTAASITSASCTQHRLRWQREQIPPAGADRDGGIAALIRDFPQFGDVLPAMGYSPQQIFEPATTVNRSAADVVAARARIDLTHVVQPGKPVVRARYEYAGAAEPGLGKPLNRFLDCRSLLKPR